MAHKDSFFILEIWEIKRQNGILTTEVWLWTEAYGGGSFWFLMIIMFQRIESGVLDIRADRAVHKTQCVYRKRPSQFIKQSKQPNRSTIHIRTPQYLSIQLWNSPLTLMRGKNSNKTPHANHPKLGQTPHDYTIESIWNIKSSVQ